MNKILITVLVSVMVSTIYTVCCYKWDSIVWKLRLIFRNKTVEMFEAKTIICDDFGGEGLGQKLFGRR